MKRIVIFICLLITNHFTLYSQDWVSVGKINNRVASTGFTRKVCLDPDGNFYCAGEFTNNAGKRYVAKYNKSTNNWSELGGFNSLNADYTIEGLYSDSLGNIYTSFYISNAVSKSYVGKWNKATNTWSTLYGNNNFSFSHDIYTFLTDGTGNVYAAGDAWGAGYKRAVFVLDKSTNNWSELGGSNSLGASSSISTLSFDNNKNIYAAGSFVNTLGKYYVAKFDKTSNLWSELGGTNSSTFNNWILTSVSDKNGNIYVAGRFTNSIGYNYVAMFNKQNGTWSELGGANSLGANGEIESLSIDKNDNIYASGRFTNINGSYYTSVYNKITNTWGELGGLNSMNANSVILSMAIDTSGNIYCGGNFWDSKSIRQPKVWKRSTNAWENIGNKNDLELVYPPHDIITNSANQLFLCGYNYINQKFIGLVTYWDGITWNELGNLDSIPSLNKSIKAIPYNLAVDKNNNLYCAGTIVDTNNNAIVAMWNKNLNKWVEVFGNNKLNANNQIWSIKTDLQNNVYVGGDFTNNNNKRYISKFDKNINSWIELGGNNSLKADSSILTINADSLGNIYAGGEFRNINGNCYVAYWNNLTNNWSELGGANSLKANARITSMVIDKSGNVYVAGDFKDASNKRFVAKWNKTTNLWAKLGNFTADSTILQLNIDISGNIFASGYFLNTLGNKYIAKYKQSNGTWSEIKSNSIGGSNVSTQFYPFCIDGFGNLYSNAGAMPLGTFQYIARFGDTSTMPIIKGRIITPIKKVVKDAQILCSGTYPATAISGPSGDFQLLLARNAYTLRLTKNNDITKANGLNATDVLFVQRHILGSPKLNSAYKIIAADVNGDKVVNATDLLRIKRLILGTDTTFTKGSGATKVDRLWEFVDSAYQFPDTTNPFPFKDSISFTNLTSNKTNQTFIGVKLGDVNYDWNPAVAKQSTVNSIQLKANTDFKIINNELRIPITVNNFKDIVAMQYTLHFDNTKYEFVNLEGFKNLQGFDYNTSQANTNGNISFLWTDKNAVERSVEDGTELFTLVLRSTVNGRLSTDLTLTSDLTEVAAWDKYYNQHNIILSQKSKLETQNTNEVIIYPNPTKGLVNLYVEALVGKGNIVIADVYGKLVKTQPLNLGTNTVDITNLSKGIYFVSIITNEGKTTKKLVVE